MAGRKLRFTEGTSSKFWHAVIEGQTVTVTFGRIGTSGQAQEKTYASSADATKAFDKQVSEKLKKGYVDEPASATTATAPAPVAKKASKKGAQTPPADATRTGDAPPGPKPFVRPPVQIRLRDADRARARLGVAPPPLPRPPTETYDATACIARLTRLGKPEQRAYGIDWERAELTLATSREEAWVLWSLVSEHEPIGNAIARVEAGPPVEPGPPSGRHYLPSAGMALLVYRAFGLDVLVEMMFDGHWSHPLREGFERDVAPYLTEDERAGVRSVIHARAAKQGAYGPSELCALSAVGEWSDRLRDAIRAWPDGSGVGMVHASSNTHFRNDALRALYAIGDPDEIAREANRLEANPVTPAEARTLLAAIGTRALDRICASVQAAGTKADAEAHAKVLALVEAPECAPRMLQVLLRSQAPGIARAWLDEHPEHGAEGVVSVACTPGALGDAALKYLRGLHKRELSAALDAALATLPDAQAATLREKITSTKELEHAVVTDDELPPWAKLCFGDPTKLVVPDVELSGDQLHPTPHVDVDAPPTPAAVPALPAFEPLPAPAPFDMEACLATLLATHGAHGGLSSSMSWHVWRTESLDLALPMTKQEAHFWLFAVKSVGISRSPADVERRIRTAVFDGEAPSVPVGTPVLIPAAFALGGTTGLASLLVHDRQPRATVDRAVRSVVRHLSASERDALREHLLDAANTSTTMVLLAQRLGATRDQLRVAFTRMTPDLAWGDERLDLLAALGDPSAITSAAASIELTIRDGTSAARWLAMTGRHGVPTLADSLARAYDKPGLLKALARVAAPEIAVPMLASRKTSALKEIARQWMEAHPVFVIQGLLPLVGTKDKLAAAAVDHLREMRRRGFGEIIAAHTNGDPNVQKLVLDPKAGLARPTDADEALAALLPQIAIDTDGGARRLTTGQVATILAELRASTLGAPTPRLLILRDNADRLVLDTFAWALFEGWLEAGAPSKERWKFEALGHLGHDASALKLAAMIRVWPGESQHQRAVTGLEVLRAIGSDTALMQIHGIGQKVSFKGIKERANECLDGIAVDRGMSRDELADRIIPDGGLDERGSRTFDFGPRAFTFVLGSDLKPMVRDASGKRLPDLPKPNSKDDAALAQRSVAAWKLLKKQVADVAKTQAGRLELAMIVGRRWTPQEFDSLFLRHPLMVHLVRRLIWCAYDADAKPLSTFRVGDDDTLSDASDSACELSATATHVGVVHPSHLTDDERAAWGEVLSDYEIIPPFVQLGRPTYQLTESETQASAVARFGEHDVDAKTLVFGLEALGWTRGTPQDGGGFYSHHKAYGDVIAVVSYRDGCWAGSNGDDWNRQRIDALAFTRDAAAAREDYGWGGSHAKDVPLADIDPVIVSEALHDVTRLYERGKPA